MRCDLHVHTRNSGMCGVPVLNRFCRESYSDPQAVYDTLKRRGMNLVTITDHDSIAAVELLGNCPDFFLSEEVTCTTPSGTGIHIGVYGMKEKHHDQLQRRRNDLSSLISYLNEQELFFSINHVFSCLTGPRTGEDFAFFEQHIPAFETVNGIMPSSSNRCAAQLARYWRKGTVGGSDAHTLAGVGLTYTEVRGANSVEEYLRGLRQGRTHVLGSSGSYLRLTRAVLEIGLQMAGEAKWPIVLAPLLAAIPLFTLVNYAREVTFAGKWFRRVMNGTGNLVTDNLSA